MPVLVKLGCPAMGSLLSLSGKSKRKVLITFDKKKLYETVVELLSYIELRPGITATGD